MQLDKVLKAIAVLLVICVLFFLSGIRQSAPLTEVEILESGCNNADLKIRSPMCFEGNQIKIDIISVGESDISSIILRVKGPEPDQDIEIEKSNMVKGEVLARSVPFILTKGLRAEFLTKFRLGGEEQLCPKPVLIVKNIPQCQ